MRSNEEMIPAFFALSLEIVGLPFPALHAALAFAVAPPAFE